MSRGSEIVFELYEKSGSHSTNWFIRVLWSGQPMVTSTPLGTLDMIPLDDFLGCEIYELYSGRLDADLFPSL